MPQVVISDIDKSTVRDLMGTEPIKKDPNLDHVYIRRDKVEAYKKLGWKVIRDNEQADVVLVGKAKEAPVEKPVAKGKKG